ncbi:hypothetical protein [Pararhodonellum marinum]|uniref:hypothetical protein n=1 Tax=Pararhodonellum marinum TaxID=2755358 RepID=UPI00188E3707|nr:hypothetical protein [Pararhodonellum marinum]
MKKLMTIVFVACYSLVNAQDYKKEIEADFTAYINSIVNFDFEQSVEYIVPEVFEIVPKAQMISVMEQSFNNPSLEIKIKNPEILKIEDHLKIQEKYYALLTYSNQMDMKVKSEQSQTEDETINMVSIIKLSLDNTFGAANVKYNDDTGFFEIQSEKDVYCISDNGITNWKFLVVEKNQKAILEKILPQELIGNL